MIILIMINKQIHTKNNNNNNNDILLAVVLSIIYYCLLVCLLSSLLLLFLFLLPYMYFPMMPCRPWRPGSLLRGAQLRRSRAFAWHIAGEHRFNGLKVGKHVELMGLYTDLMGYNVF